VCFCAARIVEKWQDGAIRGESSMPINRKAQTLLRVFIILAAVLVAQALTQGYDNLRIAVYFRYQEVHSIPANLESFAAQWANVEKQVKVDKVYLETTRNAQLATDAEVTTLKKFFAGRGIKTSGALGLTVNEPNGFQSYCYSTPADRDKVKMMVEFTARHFDEIILDDFFFTNCKCDRCILAKGAKSWTQFRTEQMDEVSRNLIIGPARAVNPKVRIIIKYPNWYESFQGLGYDLAVQPKLFDAIYTGTETRDPNSGQRLQPYQSYLQTQYFNNIKPGGNQGGWIDGGRDVERYAEQMWDTFFAKVPEIMLFNSMQIAAPLNTAFRPDADSTLSLAGLTAPIPGPAGGAPVPSLVARIAGSSAELLDRFLGKLGRPVGVAAYKPPNSVGEAYLADYLGMIGIPMDLVPEYPAKSATVLLTAASRFDKDLIAKVKRHVQTGGRVIATTGLIEAMGDRGFQDIAEIEVTGHRVMAVRFPAGRGGFMGGRGAAAPAPAPEPELNILLPQMRQFENDAWPSVSFNTARSGYPMVISAAYALAIPDDVADLYRLPDSALNQMRSLLGRDVYVNLEAPTHVSLFAYDNRTFIIQNYQSQPVNARVLVVDAKSLRDLLTDQVVAASQSGTPLGGARGFGGGSVGGPSRTAFEVKIPAHSFRVFRVE
jgi:hypothetical protein